MIKAVLLGVSIFAFFVADSAALAAGPGNSGHDCDSSLQALDDSKAEGEERLAEKYKVIEVCAGEYAHDKTINRLVNTCTKYEEQPVLKQQFLADCQLAAYRYANALRDLKEQYKK